MSKPLKQPGLARILRGAVSFAAVLLFVVGSHAQSGTAPQKPTAGQPQAAPPAPVVKVTTRLVQVSVIVQDKHGNPISDLAKDDFQVFDDGKPQEIRVFSVESSEPGKLALPPLPPHTYTNQFQQRPDMPTSVTIVLLDGLNTSVLDQTYARKEVAKFLLQLKPQDHVALYTMGRNLTVLHDFTTDSTALIRALSKYMGVYVPELGGPDPGAEDVNLGTLGGFLQGADSPHQAFMTDRRVDMTVAAFEAIARHVSGLPGRKNLIWVSGSFPISFGYSDLETGVVSPLGLASVDAKFYSDEIERAARALTDANVAVYPVDARGLIAPDLGFQSSPRIGAGRPPIRAFTMPPRALIDTMNSLADRTGGRAFYNTNDLKGAIRSAIEDSRVTYNLGFYPHLEKWDGKFHNIKVEVKRQGSHVRARKGYFALPDPQLDPTQKAAVIRQAALSPLDATGVALTVHVELPDVPGSRTIHAEIQFDARSVQLTEDSGRWDGVVNFDFMQTDNRGNLLGGTSSLLNLHLFPDTYQKIIHEGYKFRKDIEVRPNAYRVRVVVRDETSGAMGTVSLPVEKLLSTTD